MIDVTVNIIGIVMYCNENVCSLKFDCGYSIEKCYLDDFPFKEEVKNRKNQLAKTHTKVPVNTVQEMLLMIVNIGFVMRRLINVTSFSLIIQENATIC